MNELTADKHIKVYGTLVNHSLDPSKSDMTSDNPHNDAIAYARQLYDDRFGDENPINNYLDVINSHFDADIKKALQDIQDIVEEGGVSFFVRYIEDQEALYIAKE